MFDTIFGADPEVFVVDADKNCIPPAALKEDFGMKFVNEKTIIDGGEWSIVEDGAATEINLIPSNETEVISDRLNKALNELTGVMKKTFDLDVMVFPTVGFDVTKYWEGRGEEFQDCVRFGCDPDLDIYSGEYSTEISADNVPERYGGGHIHMQAPKDNVGLFDETYYHTTLLMDLIVGNSAVAFKRPDLTWIDAEKKRLKYYGRPGKIRLQEYPDGTKGIEYRTPSNFWITNPAFTEGLLTLMNTVFNLSQNPTDASKVLEVPYLNHAPKNIVSFKSNGAFKTMANVLDILGGMRYIDYDSVGRLLNLCA
jgi:hypothetical protein